MHSEATNETGRGWRQAGARVGGSLRTRSLREQINTGAAPAHERVSFSLFLSLFVFISSHRSFFPSFHPFCAVLYFISVFLSHEFADVRLYFNSQLAPLRRTRHSLSTFLHLLSSNPSPSFSLSPSVSF